jgi:hypothetical protein
MVGSDLFSSAYIHLSILLVLLKSNIMDLELNFPPEDLDLIFANLTSESKMESHVVFLLPTLFCICLVFGAESHISLKGEDSVR